MFLHLNEVQVALPLGGHKVVFTLLVFTAGSGNLPSARTMLMPALQYVVLAPALRAGGIANQNFL